MTVVACYQTKKEHWIASDSISSADDFATDVGSKVFKKNNYLIGFAISLRAGDILKELDTLPKEIKDTNDMRNFRDHVMLAMIEEGGCEPVSSQGSDTITHPLEVLVVSSYGMWYMGPDYQIVKVAEGYYAIGSGEPVATGSLFNSIINGEEDGLQAVKTACSAAIKHVGTCGGSVYAMGVERKCLRKGNANSKKNNTNSNQCKKVGRKRSSKG